MPILVFWIRPAWSTLEQGKKLQHFLLDRVAKFTSFVSWTGSGFRWVGRTPLPKFLLSNPPGKSRHYWISVMGKLGRADEPQWTYLDRTGVQSIPGNSHMTHPHCDTKHHWHMCSWVGTGFHSSQQSKHSNKSCLGNLRDMYSSRKRPSCCHGNIYTGRCSCCRADHSWLLASLDRTCSSRTLGHMTREHSGRFCCSSFPTILRGTGFRTSAPASLPRSGTARLLSRTGATCRGDRSSCDGSPLRTGQRSTGSRTFGPKIPADSCRSQTPVNKNGQTTQPQYLASREIQFSSPDRILLRSRMRNFEYSSDPSALARTVDYTGHQSTQNGRNSSQYTRIYRWSGYTGPRGYRGRGGCSSFPSTPGDRMCCRWHRSSQHDRRNLLRSVQRTNICS